MRLNFTRVVVSGMLLYAGLERMVPTSLRYEKEVIVTLHNVHAVLPRDVRVQIFLAYFGSLIELLAEATEDER